MGRHIPVRILLARFPNLAKSGMEHCLAFFFIWDELCFGRLFYFVVIGDFLLIKLGLKLTRGMFQIFPLESDVY